MSERARPPSARLRAGALVALAALAALSLPTAARAQDVVATPASLTLPTPGATDFEFGLVEAVDAVEIVVNVKKKNDQWYVFVHSDDPDLGGYGKPLSDLRWRVQGAGAWNPVQPGETLVANGTGDATVLLEVGIALSWMNDVPDTYGGQLAFRIDKKDHPK